MKVIIIVYLLVYNYKLKKCDFVVVLDYAFPSHTHTHTQCEVHHSAGSSWFQSQIYFLGGEGDTKITLALMTDAEAGFHSVIVFISLMKSSQSNPSS